MLFGDYFAVEDDTHRMGRSFDGPEPEHVRRAQQGDAEAEARIYRRLDPLLRAYFTKRLGRGPDVDDLVQNTLLRVHRSLADLEQPGRLRAFTMKAAIFELQDYYRGRYALRERLYDPEHVPARRDGRAPGGAALDAERALEALSPHARRIIELRAYGYRYREIAQMIGSTEGAIKMQVRRAFRAMRDALTAWLAALLGSGLG